jgi:hypothetical protein
MPRKISRAARTKTMQGWTTGESPNLQAKSVFHVAGGYRILEPIRREFSLETSERPLGNTTAI